MTHVTREHLNETVARLNRRLLSPDTAVGPLTPGSLQINHENMGYALRRNQPQEGSVTLGYNMTGKEAIAMLKGIEVGLSIRNETRQPADETNR